ncbi:MAG: hypothetical protein WBI17_11010 [Clostridiaceae bacterium]
MIKKLSAVLMVMMLTSMIGGGSNKKVENNIEKTNDVPGIETETEDSASIEVDKNLLSVEITLPREMAGDLSDFNKDTYLKENEGILDAGVTSDGALKIKMTKKKHQEMVDEMKTNLESSFVELIEGEDTPYIKDLSSKNDYKEITISVERATYEKTIDFTVLMVGFSVGMYQTIKGEEFGCNIRVIDYTTKELINDINYPEDIE